MTNELKPCIHAELCASGCDLADITECEYYSAERTVKVVEQVSTGHHLEDDKVRLSCGHIVNGRLPRTIPTYCDTCGAKVVSE